MNKIVIVDYGMGNLQSIQNMLKKLGQPSTITSELELIDQASKLILPGVGAFDRAMENINQLGFAQVLNRKVLEEKTPILGICLGMQLMTKQSEEGQVKGLGWFDAETLKFRFTDNILKVPHMGWNFVSPSESSVALLDYESSGPKRFYFVHSYYVKCFVQEDVMATTEYGHTFTCAINKGHIYGVQFHPEKSHKFGMGLLRKFIDIG